MKTTLKSLKTIAGAVEQSNTSRGFTAVRHRAEGRGPGVNVQWMAGLLAALAIAAGCVAQQNLSRSAAIERRAALQATTLVEPTETSIRRRFQERLQTGYLDLAMAAYERRAFSIADFFARRSIEAGGPRPPEPIAPDFDAPVDAANARREFVALLKTGGAQAAPDTAALAQLAIDCWLRESQSDGALDVRAGCRRQAHDALAALGVGDDGSDLAALGHNAAETLETKGAGAALAALVERWGPALDRSRETAEALARPVAATLRRRAQSEQPAPKASPSEAAGSEAIATASIAAATPPDPQPAATEVRTGRAGAELALDGFGLGSARPDADALHAIEQEIVKGVASTAESVLIEGHADSVGPAGYNIALSKKRAEAVGEALSNALGGKTPPIEIRAYGESRLAVATADGVAEPRNRRVIIRFN